MPESDASTSEMKHGEQQGTGNRDRQSADLRTFLKECVIEDFGC